MKILHVPYCYYPDPVGGTEVYVSSLARVQRERGFHAAVAAPGVVNEEYGHEGIQAFRFAGSTAMTLRELYGDGDPESAANFTAILERYRRSYGSPAKMGTLTFSEIEVRPLGTGFALATGKFFLKRTSEGGGDASGHFSLVLHKGADGWKIIHDHTS